MKKVKVKGIIRRMVPQYAVYEKEIEVDEEELEYESDFLDQYFNDELRWDENLKLEFKTSKEDPSKYLKENFCEYSDLNWQCVECEMIKL